MGLKSTPLTAVSAFTANVYPPNPGTGIQAADVEAGEQALLNRTEYLKHAIGKGKTLAYGGWFLDTTGSGGIWAGPIVSVPMAKSAGMMLDLPHGAVLHAITVNISPATHASLPGTMPSLTLYKITIAGVLAATWTVSDTSPDVATYNPAHDLTLTLGTPDTVDREAYVYQLLFTQENDPNGATGTLHPARVQLS